MTKSTLSFTETEVASAVDKIIKAGKSMVRGVEELLVMAVYDSIENKSPKVANALVKALRKSTKRDAVVGFLQQYGMLYCKSGVFTHFALGSQGNLQWTSAYVSEVKDAAEGWESFKADSVPQAYDVLKSVESIMKKFDAAKKNSGPTLHDGFVPYLQAALAAFTSAEALKAAGASSKAVVAPEAAKVAETV